jgi:glycosyltransferase involved in cell wall biosynthesis
VITGPDLDQHLDRAERPTREHVLILVQNLPVPLDRRVWLECQTLVRAGYRVSVICPKGPGDPAREMLDGVRLLKYDPPPVADGGAGFALECGVSWLQTARLARRLWREDPFDVIQACNPPDTFFLIGRMYRSKGVKFVFDHHDLCPEIFRSRFKRDHGPAISFLLALERATFATADHVISTNESYRAVAVHRGRRRPADTTVVRSGPDPSVMRATEPDPELKQGRKHLCCYLGVMGHQDGVEMVIRAADELTHNRGRDDIAFALLGFGDTLNDLRALTEELDLTDRVVFTGRADIDVISRYLSTATLGLSPDPSSPFNDASTMNKTLEYMAFSLPVVAFDLHETRVSAGPAAAYADGHDHIAFADAIEKLLDDPARRSAMGSEGRRRIEAGLGWPHQAEAYRGVYERLFGTEPASAPLDEQILVLTDDAHPALVDLTTSTDGTPVVAAAPDTLVTR